MSKQHRLLLKFLSGSTCRHHCSVLLENDDFIIFKHNSHYEYLNRMSGYQTCKAYAVLYAKKDCTSENLIHGSLNYLHRWENTRITKNKLIAFCKMEYNINFEKAYESPELFEEQYMPNKLAEHAKSLTSIDGGIKI